MLVADPYQSARQHSAKLKKKKKSKINMAAL
jgi:hypothetical protein